MRILLGADGSRCALQAARDLARWLPPRGSRVDLLTVIPEPSGGPWSARDHGGSPWNRWRERAARWQDAVEEPLAHAGQDVRRLIRRGEPARVLVAESRAGAYDLVVVGARGRDDAFPSRVGSTALAVLDRVAAPVLMARERPFSLRKSKRSSDRVRPLSALLATDGPAPSRRAARVFLRLFGCASPLEPELLAVLPSPRGAGGGAPSPSESARLFRDAERELRRHLAPVEDELRGWGVAAATRVLEGDPVTSVVARAWTGEPELMVLDCRAASRDPASLHGDPTGARETHMSDVALEIARSTACSIFRIRDPVAVPSRPAGSSHRAAVGA